MVLTNLPPELLSPLGREGISEEGLFEDSVLHIDEAPCCAGPGLLSASAESLGICPLGGRASKLRLGAAFLPGFPRHLLQQLTLSLMINSLPENEAGVS